MTGRNRLMERTVFSDTYVLACSEGRDDGCCGRFPECRNCAYHLPYSLRRDCMFDECPYVVKPAVVTVKGGKKKGCVPG